MWRPKDHPPPLQICNQRQPASRKDMHLSPLRTYHFSTHQNRWFLILNATKSWEQGDASQAISVSVSIFNHYSESKIRPASQLETGPASHQRTQIKQWNKCWKARADETTMSWNKIAKTTATATSLRPSFHNHWNRNKKESCTKEE